MEKSLFIELLKPTTFSYIKCEEKRTLCESHKHHSIEFVYVESGKLYITYEDKKNFNKEVALEALPGQFAIIKPNTQHCQHTDANTIVLVLELLPKSQNNTVEEIIANDYFINLLPNTPLLNISTFEPVEIINDLFNVKRRLENMIRYLYNNRKEKEEYFYPQLDIYYRELFIEISKTIPKNASKKRYNRIISNALMIIENNSSITVAKIAKQLNVSKAYLSTIISRSLNRTTQELILEAKIKKAKKLLLNDELSITTIAKKCGYSTLRGFQICFTNSTGTSPSEYRKSALNNRFIYWEYHETGETGIDVSTDSE